MNILEIKELAKYVDIDEAPSDWVDYDKQARETFNKEWLDVDFQEIFDFYGLDIEFRERFLREIEVLKKDINLNYLVYLWYFIMFKLGDNRIPRWKMDMNYFKSHGSFMMMTVALLIGYGVHQETIRRLDFDDEQIEAHKDNIRLTCISDKNRLGIDGIRFSQMIWGARFIRGSIIQVGALQYELKTKFLDGEDVIFIHIPRNASLDDESIKESFQEARKLVPKYLTDANLKYVTESWLLSPELKDILSEDSNIIKFQKNFDIIKRIENIKDFLNFVFNEPLFNGNYDNLAEDTSLQRGLKKKILNNEKLYIGIGILK